MLKVAVGHSNDPDSDAAIAEVLQQIHTSLAGVEPTAGILFAAIDFDHGLVLQRIVETFPQMALIGGTTDGEMSSVLGFEQDSLILMVLCSDTITIRAGLGQTVSQDAIVAAQTAVQQASVGHSLPVQFCISLPESLTTSGVVILESLKQALGEKIPVFGGLTADQWRSRQTYQFFRQQVYSDALPILLFSGPVLFSHGIASGWHPIGKPGQVTNASQNVVYEIDRQPALSFYQRYLGALPPSLEYPLAVFDPESDRYYMRAPSGTCDPDSGSITFIGDVPIDATVQITETTRSDILSASQQSIQQALEQYPGEFPSAALFFSCAGRRQILGGYAKDEFSQAQACLRQQIPSCGFYTNGEIAPLQQQGVSYLHNETFVTLLLGDV